MIQNLFFPKIARLFSAQIKLALCLLISVGVIACDQPDAAEISNDSGTLIVLNKSGYTAMIIDMATREVLAELPTGVAPHEAAVSPDGKTVIVSDYGEYDGEPGETLTVIDLETREVEREINMGEYKRPHGLAWFDDGEHLAVTAEVQQALLVLHVPSEEVVQVIPTEQDRSHIVKLSSDNSLAFVANVDFGTMSVIDLEAGEVIALVETGEGAEGIAISPDESELWISNRYVDTVSIVDLETYEVIETLPAGEFPIRSNFTPDGRHVLVANMNGGDVSVFDAEERTELMRIDLEPDSDQNAGPVGMLNIPGNKLLVAGTQTDRLYVIDLSSFEIIDHIETGDEPDGMAFIAGQ
ncbi:MAG: cytochrome D1 domain-containing protein [Balneolaceae bacterium]